jgi:hypothetical protein
MINYITSADFLTQRFVSVHFLRRMERPQVTGERNRSCFCESVKQAVVVDIPGWFEETST